MEAIAPFAFRPPPLPDELLSSWILRTAAGMLMKPYDFTHTYWRSRPPVLTRDVDRLGPINIIQGMAEGTETSLDRASQTALHSLSGYLFEDINLRGYALWLTPIGVRSRNRSSFGLQYCPKCFEEDQAPYLRKSWRLAISTVCLRHAIVLADRCPECAASLAPHRSKVLDKCWKCSCALSSAVTAPAWPEVVQLQAQFETVLREGWAVLGKGVVHYAPRYFLLVRQLLQLVNAGPRRTPFVEAIGKRNPALLAFVGSPRPNETVENLPPAARHDLFSFVAPLLADWPDCFVEAAQDAELWRSKAFAGMEDVPWDYHRIVMQNLDKTSYQIDDGEIRSVIAYLERVKGRVKYVDLVKLIGKTKRLQQIGIKKFVKEVS